MRRKRELLIEKLYSGWVSSKHKQHPIRTNYTNYTRRKDFSAK
ncbi:hypothetical protein GCM10025794_30010 [Massilia kyonggiensis]